MAYDIYLYEVAENGKKVGCWRRKSEFARLYYAADGLRTFYFDKECTVEATPDNIYDY